jgi:hypothetical protein
VFATALIGTTDVTLTAEDMNSIDSTLNAEQSLHEIASSVMKRNIERQEDDSDDYNNQSGISEPKLYARKAIATLTCMRSLPMTTSRLERFVNKCATEEKKQMKMTEFFSVKH